MSTRCTGHSNGVGEFVDHELRGLIAEEKALNCASSQDVACALSKALGMRGGKAVGEAKTLGVGLTVGRPHGRRGSCVHTDKFGGSNRPG